MDEHAFIWRKWNLPESDVSDRPLWEKILCRRGYDTAAKQRALLLTDPLDPFAFRDMEKAILLMRDVLERRGHIVVFGDYDADGLTAAAILVRLLRHVGGFVSWLIPDRLDDGYGISSGHVDKLLHDQPDLVITVDCGSNSQDEVRRLKAAGIFVIVTDHHVVDMKPDMADAHINPREEPHVEDLLSGAGVAYLLAEAYLQRFGDGDGERVLATLVVLAMVGTVADIMPLTGANRSLVKAGLAAFLSSAPPGLLQLCKANTVPNAGTIAYSLAPALNAASRLGQAETALHLLLCDDEAEAFRLSGRLRDLNERRRELEHVITEDAVAQAKATPLDQAIIVVREANWHTGVLGIVAARLVERFGKAAIVLNKDGTEWQGSARAPQGFDLHALLTKTSEHLTRYGGHHRAAGLAVAEQQFEAFVAALQQSAAKLPDTLPPLQVDALLSPDDLSQTELERLALLEPCGEANPEPLTAAIGCRIVAVRQLGHGEHARIEVDFNGMPLSCVMFRRGDLADFYGPGDVVDLVGKPVWHTFRNQAYAQLLLSDIRPSACGDPAYDEPLRSGQPLDLFAANPLDAALFEQTYRLLIQTIGYAERLISPILFAKRLSRAYNRHYSGLAVVMALTILAEARMLTLRPTDDERHVRVRLIEKPVRANLRDTPAWQNLEAKGWLKL